MLFLRIEKVYSESDSVNGHHYQMAVMIHSDYVVNDRLKVWVIGWEVLYWNKLWILKTPDPLRRDLEDFTWIVVRGGNLVKVYDSCLTSEMVSQCEGAASV